MADGRDNRSPVALADETAPPAPPPARAQATVPEEVYRRRRRWLGAALVVLAAGAVVGIAMLPARHKDTPAAKRSVTNVTVLPVVAADFVDAVELPGVAEPNRTVTVSARVDGQVREIPCVEGRPCRRGAKLVAMETELLSAHVAQCDARVKECAAQLAGARAQRNLAKSERDSTKELYQRGASTHYSLQQAEDRLVAAEAGVEQADAALDGARAALKLAKLDEGYATITAPIDGVLDKLLVEEGEYVTAGAPVARIVDAATVRVVVDVPQRDVGYVELDDEAAIEPRLDGGDEAPRVKGRVDYIGELADPQAKTTRVEVLVGNVPRVLRSGQIVRVSLRRSVIRRAVMVPLEAIIQMEEGRAVYVVDAAGKAERRMVTLGIWRGRDVQIRSGLKAGDLLIVQGQRYVAPGEAVAVRRGETSSAGPSSRAASRPAASIVSSDSPAGGR